MVSLIILFIWIEWSNERLWIHLNYIGYSNWHRKVQSNFIVFGLSTQIEFHENTVSIPQFLHYFFFSVNSPSASSVCQLNWLSLIFRSWSHIGHDFVVFAAASFWRHIMHICRCHANHQNAGVSVIHPPSKSVVSFSENNSSWSMN